MARVARALGALSGLVAASWVFGCSGPAAPSPIPEPPAHGVSGVTPDGNGTIVTPDTPVNTYGLLGEDVPTGSVELKLAAATPVSMLKLRENDLVLLYQAQGARIETRNSTSYGNVLDLNGAGTLEIVGVSAVDSASNRLTLYDWCGGLRRSYRAFATQIIRIPQYQSLLIGRQGAMSAVAWNGQTGGIVAVRVENELTLDGAVDASGKGFRGGATNRSMVGRLPAVGTAYRSANQEDGGIKGESIAGGPEIYALTGQYGRGAPANGGGGGNRVLSGGGGGANGGSGADWTGQGVMSPDALNAPVAWQLDPSFVANNSRITTSPGGGRGGYSYSTEYADPRIVGPESAVWGGDSRRERGGLGGHPIVNDVKQHLFFGGGGGGGDNFKSTGGAGGSGGGLVLLIARKITGTGAIYANGTAGNNTTAPIGGAGGGGGGGTIVISSSDVSGVILSAQGGVGGDAQSATLDAAGPGGGGGGGYIATPPVSVAVRVVDGARAGASFSAPMGVFTANGATAGKGGQQSTHDGLAFAGIPFCSTADLAIAIAGSPTPAQRREPTPYRIAVSNLGPSPSREVEVNLKLPAGAEILEVQAPNWECTTSVETLFCQRHAIKESETSEILVSARPPLATSAGLATATVKALSVDPNPDNNTADSSIDINEPLLPYAAGGGLACSSAGSPRRSGAESLWLAVLLLVAWGRRGRAGNRV